MQISLEVERENFHKEMPFHSNCLVSETVRSLPDDYTMRSIKHYLKEPLLLHQQHGDICANKGLFGRVAVKKPFIRQQNRKRHLTLAKEHKDWTKNEWNKVLWTDESKFELFSTSQKFMCNNAQVSGSLTTAVKQGGNIMVWGSISGGRFCKNRKNNGQKGES